MSRDFPTDPGIVRSTGEESRRPPSAALALSLAMRDAGEGLSRVRVGNGGRHAARNRGAVPTQSPLSEEFSKALKARGFKFVGPVIVYAWMQAVGIVNDHAAGCFRRKAVSQGRR